SGFDAEVQSWLHRRCRSQSCSSPPAVRSSAAACSADARHGAARPLLRRLLRALPGYGVGGDAQDDGPMMMKRPPLVALAAFVACSSKATERNPDGGPDVAPDLAGNGGVGGGGTGGGGTGGGSGANGADASDGPAVASAEQACRDAIYVQCARRAFCL